MKVVMQFEAGPALAARLQGLAAHGLEVTACMAGDEAPFAAAMKQARALWHVLEPVSAEVMAAAPGLELVQKIGVGVNTIDLEAAGRRGIAVCNMPGTNSRAVAEMTLMLMLAALRRLAQFDAAVRRGTGWDAVAAVQNGLGELGGRCVGLVGYGAVPRLLAPMLRAMGAPVIYTARAPKSDAEADWRSLDRLLGEADVVSLHVPLDASTEGMIDGAAIARMKPGAVLINTARGGLVDEAALVAALASGRLGAAGLDVFAEEPAGPGNPLFALPNVVLAPHVAWLTTETIERSLAVAVDNCRRLQAGRELLHRVA